MRNSAPDLDRADALRRYAEELAYTGHLTSRAVVEAFARVSREHYLGPGPWRIFDTQLVAYPEPRRTIFSTHRRVAR